MLPDLDHDRILATVPVNVSMPSLARAHLITAEILWLRRFAVSGFSVQIGARMRSTSAEVI